MADGAPFAHVVNGVDPGQRMQSAGYSSSKLGENIGGNGQTAQQAVEGWLKSPSHCDALMDPAFKQVGVGWATGPSGTRYVQNFGAG